MTSQIPLLECFLRWPAATTTEPRMRQILETEDHVAVPPMMYADPFYRITFLIKQEIRAYKMD